MKCKEFTKTFNCYITFTKSGFGQIFGLGNHLPVYMPKLDFWVPTTGEDTALIKFLVEDFDDWKNKNKALIIFPSGEVKVGSDEEMTTGDYVVGDSLINVKVKVSKIIPSKTEAGTSYIMLVDEKNDTFIQKTKSTKLPDKGSEKLLSGVIKENFSEEINGIPSDAMLLSNVKLLQKKK